MEVSRYDGRPGTVSKKFVEDNALDVKILDI